MAQYIDKDALVAEITHKIKVLKAFIKNFDGISDKVEKAKNKIEVLGDVLLFIDTLEVKEVDLEKEIANQYESNYEDYLTYEEFTDIAKHFFELGVNASNPLTWEDVKLIWTIGDEIPYMPEEDFFKELLKRFKAQKGK